MTHDIIDNRSVKLVDVIRTTLPGSESAKFAVGYFFLSGLEAVADTLRNVRDLRLLIGNTSNRETIEQIAEGYRRIEQVHEAAEALQFPKRTAMEASAARTAAAVGETLGAMDQTDAAAELVSVLIDLIETGRLSVRVYTRGRLHAKTYIFDYGPAFDTQGQPVPRLEHGVAITGSSNFTLSGIASNTELNVIVNGNENHAALTAWFEALWADAQDFDAHLMQALQASWSRATVTPYQIYLKTLYELVRDQLEGADGAELLWHDEITSVLTEFQQRAVVQAIAMIRRYGGCFVADVVGLGKSYIGAAIVKHFERHDRARPLIICPPPLVEMWEHYNEAYQLNARVLSMGMLKEDEALGPEWMLHDERTRYRDFVLIDESHNFRNTGNQRYRVLQSYLSTGERRVVMLTATPRNKSLWDVYNQLKLFHPEDVTDLPIDPPHLRDYFRLVEAGERRLPELLAHLLIRRRRIDVLRWYGYDAETGARVDPDAIAPYRNGKRKAFVWVGGRKQFFPDRHLQTVEYSIEATYAGLYDELRACLTATPPGGTPVDSAQSACAPLTYARYGLWGYVKPGHRDHPPYDDLRRAGATLRGLMRVMLFKRLESSVHAFRQTVATLLRTHRAFLAALDAGIVAAGDEAQELLRGSDADEEQSLVDALEALTTRYRLEDFEAAALRADVAHDVAVLEHMLGLVAPISPAHDAKLQTLLARLDEPELRGRKVLIFTQYADTAQYLYDALVVARPGTEVDVIFSQGRNRAQVVGRFAPRANPQDAPADGTPEIDTLIATDVLSEGLNLQDCDTLINYDLHWNPVRLIQRFGRIDRIGTEHDRIHALNFLPERTLEQNLGLQEKLRRRIQEIHDTIGEDAAILDPLERLNEEALYAIYGRGDVVDDESDVDAYIDMNEALETVRQLREDDPELFRTIATLSNGVRCGYRKRQGGAVVLCRAGRYAQLYQVDASGEIVTREAPRILKQMACSPDEPAAPLPDGHNARVMAVKRTFDREVIARRAEQRHTAAQTRAQRYVLQELRALYAASDAALQPQIAQLDAVFQHTITRPVVQTALNRMRRERLTGQVLLDELAQLYTLHGLASLLTDTHAERDATDGDLPIIVCSEGWLPD